MDGDEAETPGETSLANNDAEAGTYFDVAATVPVETSGDALDGVRIFGGDDDKLFVLGGNEREKSEDDSQKIHEVSVPTRTERIGDTTTEYIAGFDIVPMQSLEEKWLWPRCEYHRNDL